ncbi:MAG: hypothetical protein HQL33_01595, partial [Alphaproteobacteria bacterium]|nr:hypothetical protein [Alphaproteobacteria bacterium]
MNEDWTMNVIWWISAVELPVMAGLFWLFWSGQRETDEDLDRIRLDIEHGLARSNEALSAFKLEVAKSYASISTLKDVE